MDRFAVVKRISNIVGGHTLTTTKEFGNKVAIDFQVAPENLELFKPRGVYSSFIIEDGDFDQFELRLPKSRELDKERLVSESEEWLVEEGVEPLVQGENVNNPTKSNVFIPDGKSLHISIYSEELMTDSSVKKIDKETALDLLNNLIEHYRELEDKGL